MGKKLGLTPLEVAIINLTMGGGRKNYGEVGYLANSMFKWRIPETIYRPRFMGVCGKGLVTYSSWDDLKKYVKMRPVFITRKGAEVIAAIGMMESERSNNDEAWRWNNMFDPFENYAKNPGRLDKFLPGKLRFDPKKRPSRRQVFKDARQNIIDDEVKKQLLFD